MTEELLGEVQKVLERYEEAEKSTGENFNIFSILDMETNEVKTHSSFLAELLNPKGTHGQGSVFLEIFKDVFCKDFTFNTSSAKVYTEFYIGVTTETTGGRLDIYLHDNQGDKIMIENKIYAEEQKNQLLRYHNFAPNGKLFYLTLDGKDSNESLSKEKYTSISYKVDIVNWLEECRDKVENVELLRESINIYINLIKKITNQNLNVKMDKEIKDIIMSSKESQKTAIKIAQATNSLHDEFIKKLDDVIENSKTLKNNIEMFFEGKGSKGELVAVKRYPHHPSTQIIRFNLFFGTELKDEKSIKFQISYENNLKLKTLFWDESYCRSVLLENDLDNNIFFTKESSKEILEKVEKVLKEVIEVVLKSLEN